MDSAISLFSTKGYDATSIQDIVAHSGLSVGTVYNYFSNKEELLTSIIDEGWGEFFTVIKAGLEEKGDQYGFEDFYKVLFDVIVDNIDIASLCINEPLLFPKLSKIGEDLFLFTLNHPQILPENVTLTEDFSYNKTVFYASALGIIQAIRLGKGGYIDIDINKLKQGILDLLTASI